MRVRSSRLCHVVPAHRITKRVRGNDTPTSSVKLTFSCDKLPEKARLGYNQYTVKPPVLQCYKCREFNHYASDCRGTQRCARCGADQSTTRDLLWGWLGFNCGSTFGISGIKWILAARSAVSTITVSIAGGIMGFLLSYIVNNRRFDIGYMINGVLGSLVGITALCAMAQPWESIIIGAIGSLIVNGSIELLNKLKIDDPVGCVGTHAVGGMWSLLSAGLFSRRDTLADALQHQSIQDGLFHGGGFNQLGIQALAVLAITVWTVVLAVIFLKVIDFVVGIRMPLVEELIGADIVEHGIGEIIYDKKHRKLLNLGQYQRQSVDAIPNESREQVRTVMSQHGRRGSGLLGHCHVLSDAE
ncbi:hypothetical protein ScPMuIL_011661, partial [Solemya velum]